MFSGMIPPVVRFAAYYELIARFLAAFIRISGRLSFFLPLPKFSQNQGEGWLLGDLSTCRMAKWVIEVSGLFVNEFHTFILVMEGRHVFGRI